MEARDVALALVLAGCGGDALPCGLPAGTDVLDCLVLDVTAPTGFDQVDVIAAHSTLLDGDAIRTPAIEAGVNVPNDWIAYERAATQPFAVATATTAHFELLGDGWQKEVAVIASRDGAVVATGGLRLNLESANTDNKSDLWYGGTVNTLATSRKIEIWGSNGEPACARIELDKTFYIVRADDADCDGIGDDVDPNPRSFDPM